MQNSKRESTGNGTAPLADGGSSPTLAGAEGVSDSQLCSLRTWKIHAQHPPRKKPGQAPHRAAGTFPGVTTTYEPGYEKPSASPRESYWTC